MNKPSTAGRYAPKTLRSLSLGVVVAAAAACSGAPSTNNGDHTALSRQPLSQVPLFFTQYGSGLSFRSAEVDDAGNTYVLSHAPQQSWVDVFDASGAHASRFLADSGRGPALDLRVLRVNGQGVVAGGEFTTPDGPAVTSHVLIDRFDVNGNALFKFAGPKDTHFEAVDLCSDGTTIAAYDTAPAQVVAFDASGHASWTTALPFASASVSKLRCLGDGTIVIAGTEGLVPPVYAYVAQVRSDGTVASAWTGSDPIVFANGSPAAVTFDVDGDGNPYAAATTTPSAGVTKMSIFALDTSGSLQWSWSSDGTSDAASGIYVSDVVAITGTRQISSTESHYLTTELDASGNALWTRDDPFERGMPSSAKGISLDGNDDAFVCGSVGPVDTGAMLYDSADGSTLLMYDMESIAPRYADVTNGVGRCVGQSGSGIAVLGFQVY